MRDVALGNILAMVDLQVFFCDLKWSVKNPCPTFIIKQQRFIDNDKHPDA